jgi:hypothetical protein
VRFKPSRSLDLHALAVLIYRFLFRRSPVASLPGVPGLPPWGRGAGSGRAVFAEDGELLSRLRDPAGGTGASAREDPDGLAPWTDTLKLPFTSAGPLSRLFELAFADGLQEPPSRPDAKLWEDGLLRTADSLLPCSGSGCPSGWFAFVPPGPPACPYCGRPYAGQSVPVLKFGREEGRRGGEGTGPEESSLAVFHDLYIYRRHAFNFVPEGPLPSAERQKPVGYFSHHNGQWILVNQNLRDLEILGTGKTIPPGRTLPLASGQRIRLSRENGGRVAEVAVHDFTVGAPHGGRSGGGTSGTGTLP